jgi:riboflavin biosynthesis pyrimidine reductase
MWDHPESIMVKANRRSSQFARLRTLVAAPGGQSLPLPAKLARIYGAFRMPRGGSRCHVFSNFVSTLDGVVSLQVKGHSGGGDISGFSSQDRLVMGLLRAVSDIIVVGSGTLEADPKHLWTPEGICPELAADYRKLQHDLGKPSAALNVVVSSSGSLNLRLPVFASGMVPAMILTTTRGAKRLLKQKVPDTVNIQAVPHTAGEISAAAILENASRFSSGKRVLVEGGPRLLGAFYQERLMDEQFLSLAPQLAGRETGDPRMSLVMGKLFAPRDPRWGTLIDARMGSELLFLRYSFSRSIRGAVARKQSISSF